MLDSVQRLLRRTGQKLVKLGTPPGKESAVVTLPATAPVRGRVLMSYIIDPFLQPGQPISNDHTHFWESHAIARAFTNAGFTVDVIHFQNNTFQPHQQYDFFIGARTNFERLAQQLPDTCTKIVHLDTAHWLYNNHAAMQRLQALKSRRNFVLSSAKMVEQNWALEAADMGTVLGNEFTMGTYRYAQKPLHRIPISNPLTYPWPDNKDFNACRRRFMWFGSSGFVHKGLDVTLEAFAQMPEFELIVCGPVDQERAFCEAFKRELEDTPNITLAGWVDVASPGFADIANSCIGLVYPTCSEGGGGSVITCMHAGLIPVVTEQASVDLNGTGALIPAIDIRSIQETVKQIANKPADILETMARNAWQTARENHSREIFAASFERFLQDNLLADKPARITE